MSDVEWMEAGEVTRRRTRSRVGPLNLFRLVWMVEGVIAAVILALYGLVGAWPSVPRRELVLLGVLFGAFLLGDGLFSLWWRRVRSQSVSRIADPPRFPEVVLLFDTEDHYLGHVASPEVEFIAIEVDLTEPTCNLCGAPLMWDGAARQVRCDGRYDHLDDPTDVLPALHFVTAVL